MSLTPPESDRADTARLGHESVGAFIELVPGTDGMCHISELADGFVKNVTDVVKMGDIVRVKVVNIDDSGRIKLSRKAVLMEEAAKEEASSEGSTNEPATV